MKGSSIVPLLRRGGSVYGADHGAGREPGRWSAFLLLVSGNGRTERLMDEKQTLRQTREAIQQGNRAEAQRLLYQVIQANPRNEIAQRHLAKLSQLKIPSEQQPTSPRALVPSAACPSCGKPITESDVFCSSCGQDLRSVALPQTPEALPQTPEPQVAASAPAPQKEGKKSRTVLWLLVAAAVALLACCVIAVLWSIGSGGGSAVPGSEPLTVEYGISGTAKGADLTFTNSDGRTEQYSPMPVPYTVKLTHPQPRVSLTAAPGATR
jgi:hypothetical protein